MKRQKTMFSFLSTSEGKKSRTETVTGNIKFRGKQNYIQGASNEKSVTSSSWKYDQNPRVA